MRGMRFAVAGLLAVGMVAILQAQPGGFGGGFGNSVTALVTNKAVQEDIKATEEQVKKLGEWTKEFGKKAAEIRKDKGVPEFGKGGGGGGKGGFGKIDDETREKMEAANHEINKEAYKELGDILKKEQIDRLKQIQHQQMGINAFVNTDVVEMLKLTDSQKTSVKGITGDYTKEQREIFADAGFGGKKGGGMFDAEKFQEAQKKIQKLGKEYIGKVVDTLDDTQKKTWKEMTGEPFDLTKLQFQFGKGKDTKKD
jgi:hypothetical protein